MKLSERLGNAVGVGPFSHAVSDDAPVVVTAGLLREAAELARRVEDAEIAEPAMQSGRLVSVIVREGAHYKGQRLRLVPEDGQEVGK